MGVLPNDFQSSWDPNLHWVVGVEQIRRGFGTHVPNGSEPVFVTPPPLLMLVPCSSHRSHVVFPRPVDVACLENTYETAGCQSYPVLFHTGCCPQPYFKGSVHVPLQDFSNGLCLCLNGIPVSVLLN